MDITLLDGGMGQELLARTGDEPTPLWATQVMLDHPDVVREIWRMLCATKKAAPAPANGVDTHPFGLAANRKNLELIIEYSWEQKMLPRKMSVDECFNDLTATLEP